VCRNTIHITVAEIDLRLCTGAELGVDLPPHVEVVRGGVMPPH
jgi:hypothetical protein